MRRGIWVRAEHGLEQKLYIYEDVVSESGQDTAVSDLENFVVEAACPGATSFDSRAVLIPGLGIREHHSKAVANISISYQRLFTGHRIWKMLGML